MQNILFDFEAKLTQAKIAVVGLGKIGLPLVVQYTQHGFEVIGCDINPDIIETLNAGQSPLQEEPGIVSGIAEAVANGLLTATVNTTEAVRQSNVVVVIVPVLVDAKRKVDFRAIDAATSAIGAGLQPDTLVIYETTLPIGTTLKRLRTLLEYTSHLQADSDFYLANSPERVFSGHILRDLRTYPKIVGGINERSTAAAATFYRSVLDVPIISMGSTDEAEFVKIIENVYRDVNIALANEFACYADEHGLDIGKAISAANSQPTSHIHSPGIGVGGHCIPVYPYFLFEDREEIDYHDQHIEPQKLTLTRCARKINDAMAEYAVNRLEQANGSLAQQVVLILGVTYRGDVRETAFTSAQLIQEALLRKGAIVYVDDPMFNERELHSLGYAPLPSGFAETVDAIILQANHQAYQLFDFSRFTRCRVVLDGRNALSQENIESFGMHYIAIGDGNPSRKNPTGWEDQFDRVSMVQF